MWATESIIRILRWLPNGYRPRSYSAYPYMHNVSLYAEESLSVPVGSTMLRLMAGLRWENLFISGTQYDKLNTLSPRFNARWQLNENIAIRGGWGVTEKLPSYYVLYPRQEYRDIQTFGVSYNNNESATSITVSHILYYTTRNSAGRRIRMPK